MQPWLAGCRACTSCRHVAWASTQAAGYSMDGGVAQFREAGTCAHVFCCIFLAPLRVGQWPLPTPGVF